MSISPEEQRERQCEYSRRWREKNREKSREASRRYRASNPDKTAAYLKQWYEKNRQHALEYAHEYRSAHQEQIVAYRDSHKEEARLYRQARAGQKAEYDRAYRVENGERCAEAREQWEADNPEKVRAAKKRWRDKNHDKCLEHVHKRRARRLSADGSHTTADTQKQYEAQRGRCYYCDARLHGLFHEDHVIPLSLGGSDGPENIVVACPLCNQRKSNKHPMDWNGTLL